MRQVFTCKRLETMENIKTFSPKVGAVFEREVPHDGSTIFSFLSLITLEVKPETIRAYVMYYPSFIKELTV